MQPAVTQWVSRTGTCQTYRRKRSSTTRPGASATSGAVAVSGSSITVIGLLPSMDSAGQAGIERVDGPQDLDGPLRIADRRADQRFLQRTATTAVVARRGVP